MYLDSLSQRHTAIESRLYSLELNLAEIRRIVEQLAQEHRLEQSNEDTLIAGPKVSGSFSGEVKTPLPPLRSSTGIVLPDNAAAAGKDTARNKISEQKRRHRVPTKTVEISHDHKTESQPLHYTRPSARSRDAKRDEVSLLDTAMVALRARRFSEALGILSTLIERDSPRKGEYLYWRAIAYYQQEQYDLARSDAEAAWQLLRSIRSQRRPDVLYLLAELYVVRGDRERARQYLQMLAESFSSSDAAILARRKLQQLAIK